MKAMRNAIVRYMYNRWVSPQFEDYFSIRNKMVTALLKDKDLMARFQLKSILPANLGRGFDERLVEYPWFYSRLTAGGSTLLDVGSSLNYDFALREDKLSLREIFILTLEPEKHCFWNRRVSYIFADARMTPFKDAYFDDVVSISTIEHVGADNTHSYTKNLQWRERNPLAFLDAIREIRRVLKPGGRFYLTLPFGRKIDYGWYQQFDTGMVAALVEAWNGIVECEDYFRFVNGGWAWSNANDCGNCAGYHTSGNGAESQKTENIIPGGSEAVVALVLR
jgi:SAM-dependent methyltransferase